MKLARSIKLALKYISQAEQTAGQRRHTQSDPATKGEYGSMEYALAQARQETTAAYYIATTILESQERQ